MSVLRDADFILAQHEQPSPQGAGAEHHHPLLLVDELEARAVQGVDNLLAVLLQVALDVADDESETGVVEEGQHEDDRRQQQSARRVEHDVERLREAQRRAVELVQEHDCRT